MDIYERCDVFVSFWFLFFVSDVDLSLKIINNTQANDNIINGTTGGRGTPNHNQYAIYLYMIVYVLVCSK